ncbi:N-alpha-acetyltransferase 38-B, NatC auxiliary subunit [Diorhabda sublineata]|uniref:N-alpha-acetyltransferase 38-B, NatC auxiliary subunit n=1 Tax=Diorhabda sublineata TaxID=1163346 RepID=UPI0024E0C48E|nr:N-alpha-acetyltransferase 38-B, NatC auxiliary subunit [Diorhabda sublineata]
MINIKFQNLNKRKKTLQITMEEDSTVQKFPIVVGPKLEKNTVEIEKTSTAEEPSGVSLLRSWLNKSFKVEMTDGRVLVGIFLCTDRDANIILGSCSEYLPSEHKSKTINEEPRMLGLVMIPGKHIVSLHIDSSDYDCGQKDPLTKDINNEDVM